MQQFHIAKMSFQTSTSPHASVLLFFGTLQEAILAFPIDSYTCEMNSYLEPKRQTLSQQTQEASTATGGINNTGKITLAIFVPIIGLIIIWCFYWVCLSDKISEYFAKRKDFRAARREARKAKREANNVGAINGMELQGRQRV